MPGLTSTPFSPVLSALKAQLAASTGLPAERINTTGWDQVPHFQGDADLLIRLGNPVPEARDTDSKGRLCTRVVRAVEIACRVRLAMDPTGYTDLLYTHPQYGLLLLEEGVVNAMHQFWPEDGNGNPLLTEPVRWVPSTRPHTPANAPPEPADWGESRMTFEVMYYLPLSPTFIP